MCAAQVAPAAQPTVVFGTDRDSPPFEYLDAQGRPAGFNVQLMRAVAAELGWRLQPRMDEWSRIRRGLEVEHTIDVADMFRTPTREVQVEFSTPFLVVYFEILQRRDSPQIKSVEDLHGRTVVVQESAYASEYLRAHAPGARLVLAPTEPDAVRWVAEGRYDCAVVNGIVARHTIARDQLKNLQGSGVPLLPVEYCFAVAAGHTALRDEINRGLAALRASGEYARLYDRWIGEHTPRSATLNEMLKLAAWILGALALLAVAALGWSLTLRRTVARRTEELRRAVDDLALDVAARREQGERLRILSQAIIQSPVAVEITDRNTTILFANPRLLEMSGYSAAELIGSTPRRYASGLTPRSTYGELWATLLRGETWQGEFVNRRKDGTLFQVRSTVTPIRDEHGVTQHFLAVKEDVTAAKAEQEHRRKLEAQLVQSQKLETIGTLAGGIAHDFNNILTGILGFSQLATESLAPDHPGRPYLHEVQAGALRARDLVAQILTFSRRRESSRAPVDLSVVVGEAVKFLRATAPATIDIERRLEPGLVLADATQIHQVVLNLATNALQAMRSGPGRISIEVRRVELAAPRSCHLGQLQPGAYMSTTVADTGCGISPDTLHRIFDPFFTTKPPGEGTGLGLSLVQGIVASHEGGIDVHSTPGEGTRFEVLLPVAEGESRPAEEPADVPRGRGECVLVLDDEDAVAAFVSTRLRLLGYTTIAMTNAKEALAFMLNERERLDAIITDLTMPHLTGLDLLRQVRAAGLTPVAILTSGNPGVVCDRELTGLPDVGFVTKPFTNDSLARRLREMLDQRASPHG